AIATAKQAFDAAQAPVTRWNTASPGDRAAIAWSEIAGQLGTDAGKKRKFTGIVPAAAGGGGTTYSDLRTFITEVVSAPSFIPGRGLLIGFDFIPPPGHAIALHRESDESFVLFDPNLGIYRCRGAARLVTALVVLVEECYLTPDPGK